METEAQNSLFEMPGKPVVKIFGVGNAGISLLDALALPEFAAAQFAVVNTDGPSLAASPAPVKIHLENKLLRGLGSGGDPERGRAVAEEQFSTLKSACEGASVVFILAGLGGGSGSGQGREQRGGQRRPPGRLGSASGPPRPRKPVWGCQRAAGHGPQR